MRDPWRYALNTRFSQTERCEVTALANAGFTGKWMPFTAVDQVREVWAQIVEATEAGTLGWKAKVATKHEPGKEVLICVYTKDYRDTDDLARVLAGLRELGISRRLSYKEDAATLALRYGTGAALYVSQPGSTTFTARRDAYTSDDQHPLFADPHEDTTRAERTVEQVFTLPEPYGPFPDEPR